MPSIGQIFEQTINLFGITTSLHRSLNYENCSEIVYSLRSNRWVNILIKFLHVFGLEVKRNGVKIKASNKVLQLL